MRVFIELLLDGIYLCAVLMILQIEARMARAQQLAEGLRRRLQHGKEKLSELRTSLVQARSVMLLELELQSSCRPT